ncbi:unnamed protein product [Clonostachys chloroleuca]|uniref:non-specific serine/threonine protein kinase n=1 Tax=Clonostachys chloroleuca TaxID=1926264 RepID=A0AA35Q060_9HYPO|nr:unnamed protein product [Clonostachys chloroleuca]
MVEYRAEPVEASEERTEPISQSEMDIFIRSMGMEEQPDPPPSDYQVPLHLLKVEDRHREEGIRLIFRPLTKISPRAVSPGGSNCQWLALRAEVTSTEQPEHKVLAVTQTSKDIKFAVRIPRETNDGGAPRPTLWCELYYDPASDSVVFLNKSEDPIQLVLVSQTYLASPPANEGHTVNPGFPHELRPGTWRIKVRHVAVLDFRVLEKRPVTVYERQPSDSRELVLSSPSSSSDQINANIKRPRTPDRDNMRIKRRISDGVNKTDDSAIEFMRPGAADSLVFSLPNTRQTKVLASNTSHPLLDAENGETIAVSGVCELDEYHITPQDPIASTAQSKVYRGRHSQVPDNIVTVKVLKTRMAKPGEKAFVNERNLIRQAQMWERESQTQEGLNHGSIVKYYGGDARFLSLYMEHVDAQDLTAGPRWRSVSNDEFQGNREDAKRILLNIGEALSYLHGRHVVHNDIKPANILYSPERGAVLCDFGLSTGTAKEPSTGGTPYYVPPEFIVNKSRGPPADVWALGVTMLYVLRKIPLPDSRRHVKVLYWQIAGIHNPSVPYRKYGNGQGAASQMKEWLRRVHETREKLSPQDRLERIVSEMLAPQPSQRITMAKIVQSLNGGPASLAA